MSNSRSWGIKAEEYADEMNAMQRRVRNSEKTEGCGKHI